MAGRGPFFFSALPSQIPNGMLRTNSPPTIPNHTVVANVILFLLSDAVSYRCANASCQDGHFKWQDVIDKFIINHYVKMLIHRDYFFVSGPFGPDV